MSLTKNQRRFILVVVGLLIIFFGLVFDFLKLSSTAYLASFIAAIIVILLELYYDAQEPLLKNYVLENEDDFINTYYNIKKKASSFCYAIWCGNYSEESNWNLICYFNHENSLLLKKDPNFKFYRIVNVGPNKVTQKQFEQHLKCLQESQRVKKYFIETGDVEHIELLIADAHDEIGTYYLGLLILMDQHGKPAWGYKFNNRLNPDDYRKIMTLMNLFKKEWNSISDIKI